MAPSIKNVWTWKFVRQFLRIWLLLVLILVVVLILLYRTEINAQRAITEVDAQQVIQLATQAVSAEMSSLRGDILYLAEQSSLQQWLATGKTSSRKQLVADMLAFARDRGLYDQLRFLDARGREVVRINWNNGKPSAIPHEQLQDKSQRYYVRNSLKQERGEIYISPFDLNVERKVIEQPLKPMIRLGTPVFDREGRKRGVIVVNYLGQRLLDHLQAIRSQNVSKIWLLNADGYWLAGPDAEMEWGFMYPDREANKFMHEYAAAWSDMNSGSQHGQFMRSEGLFTYSWFESSTSPLALKGERWLLLAHVPTSILMTNMQNRVHSLWLAFTLLALLLAIVSGVITYKEILRRTAETKIRESEARFRALLDSAPDAIITVDQQGCINLVNAQTEKFFGYTRDELLGQPIECLVPERYQQLHVSDRKGYIEQPTLRPMGGQNELYALRKDGSEFPVEISLSPLESTHGLLITSIIRDITARKEAEQVQSSLEVRYEELINNLPVGVYRNTPGDNGKFLEVNPAMVKIFEASSVKELLAHPVSALYCDPAERKKFSDKITRQGYVYGEELHLKTLQGREFCAAITAVMKQQSDGSIYFDGIIENITKRKENEIQIQKLNDSLVARSTELEAINHELEAFSYSVSHDLRAPLRAIDGFSHMLLNNYADRLDDKGRDRLNRVRAGAQRMAMLIDDLLKLSRVSRVDLNREEVDLAQIASNVIEELRQGEPQREVQFAIQPDLQANADPRLLRAVMDNLLGNAWKFTSNADNAMIEVGRCSSVRGESFFVRDNGVGFDMTYADKLFGAFQRLHDHNEFPGTGIGLATVQRVINKHGGNIWAESAVGQGATFYFTLKQGEKNV